MVVLRHRRVLAALGALGLGLAAFVLLYFEPQKLFIDDVVHEAAPVASGPAAAGPQRSPRVLSSGRFRSYEHATSGRARVLELADGRRYVRFDRFSTSNMIFDTPLSPYSSHTT